MKAIVQDRFGSPDVLRQADAEVPEVGAGEVLVQVHAAALNPADWHLLRGDPRIARLSPAVGLRRPGSRIPGSDGAGLVAAVGPEVSGLTPGDPVLGVLKGSLAEFATASADRVVPKPASLGFEEAACLPMAGVTALQGLRDAAQVRPGQRVLINGAGGGVGTFAVQIARSLGAEVTGVCSGRSVDLVRSLGAAHVVDYTQVDFTRSGTTYDVVFDNAGGHSLADFRRALTPSGVFVANYGGAPTGAVFGVIGDILRTAAANLLTRQRLTRFVARPTRQDLLALTAMVDDGTLRPVLDRNYPLAEAAAALRRVEDGHVRGKVTVTVQEASGPG